MSRTLPLLLVALLLGPAWSAAPRAQEQQQARPVAGAARLLSTEPGGSLVLADQTALQIVGIRGRIDLRAAKAGELRYMSTDPRDASVPRPIDLWQDGATLRFVTRTPEGEAEPPRRLELAIPAAIEVIRVETADCEINAATVFGSLHVTGERLVVDGRALANSVKLDLQDSRVRLQGVAQSCSVEGSGIEGEINDVRASVYLTLADSRLALQRIAGPLQASLEATELSVQTLEARATIDAAEGAIKLGALARGGEIELDGTALEIDGSKGALTITTDGSARLAELEGPLVLRGHRAPLSVKGLAGRMELEAHGADVRLSGLKGEALVTGHDLTLVIVGAGGLTIKTTGSNISVTRASGAVTIDNDYGDVEVLGAAQSVKLNNPGGGAWVRDAAAAVQVRASAPEIEIGWTSFADQHDSYVENSGGGVHASFPPGGACRLQVEAREGGRIESDLPGVNVNSESTQATGALNGGARPIIDIKAAGDVFLVLAEAVVPPAPAGAAAEEPPAEP